jgi:flagellar protein FlaG
MVSINNVNAKSNFSEGSLSPKVDSSSIVDPAAKSRILEPVKLALPTVSKNQSLEDAVSQTNRYLAGGSVQFSIDGDKTIVKVIDTETNRVIRQIPSEEAIAISKSLDKLQGMLINSKA